MWPSDRKRSEVIGNDWTISVVIPTYNRAHLLSQTGPSYIQPGVAEIVVVDDGSTDDTPHIVRSLARQYPIIRHFRLRSNSGRRLCCQTLACNVDKHESTA